MEYKFSFNVDETLSKLAWIAKIGSGESVIKVIHGSAVELSEDWMVEGVWDGDFEAGNFHQSESFFGTGVRIENNKVHFVTTFSPMDRILYCEYNGDFLFSNSLILLLAYTGATLDINHNYHQECQAMCKGIQSYNRKFTILHPEIKCFYQVFRESTIFSKGKITFQHRYKRQKIESFDHYYRIINSILEKIRKNYESDKRKIPISTFTTLSQGYDSTAVSCLVKNIGVTSAFVGNRLKSILPLQKTAEEMGGAALIAKKLGYNIFYPNDKRSNISEDELYFLATTYPKHHSGAWSEVGLHSLTNYIENNCSMAVVFTGHHGDSAWDVNLPEENVKNVKVPRSMMGFCTEMRLKSGFVNVPVPGLMVFNLEDIFSISCSPEMEPWRLHNSYDRPIPRRIAEGAGVDRHLFGMQKKHIATTYTLPINHKLRKAFLEYLRKEHRIHATTVYLEYLLQQIFKIGPIGGLFGKRKPRTGETGNILLRKDVDLYFLMCNWATGTLSEKAARILSKY